MRKPCVVPLLSLLLLVAVGAAYAGPIARLAIRPAHISLRPGAVMKFDVYGLDAFENQVPITEPLVWSATKGTIEQDGTYTAGATTGRFINAVRVAAGSLSTTASVTVDAPAAQGGYIWERSWGDYCAGENVYPVDLESGPAGSLFVVEGYGNQIHQIDPTGNPITMFIPQYVGRIHGTGCAYHGNTVYLSSYEGILRFNMNGSFIGMWNSAGSAGPLATLVEVETDPSGNVYTADFGSCKVFKLSANGTLLKSWGTKGSEEGQFESISDLVVDADANVYVVDSSKRVIHKYSTDGVFLKTWATDFFAGMGYTTPEKLEIDSAGNFYFGDSSRNRAIKVSQAGEILQEYNLGFEVYPSAVAVDTQGNVNVSSAQNGCVVKFDAGGNMIAKWGGFRMGGMFQPEAVAIDPSRGIYVPTGNGTITVYDRNGRALDSWSASARTVEVDKNGFVYTVDGNGAVKRKSDGTPLVSYSLPSNLERSAIGYAATVGPNGNVYITDDYSQRVFRFSADGTLLAEWGEPNRFGWLKHITVDSSGVLWLTDAGNGNIEKLDLDGNSLGKLVIGYRTYPWSTVVAPDGTIFTAEWANDRVQRLSSSGAVLGWWGGPGMDNGKLYGPSDIAMDSHGCIYIADELNHRVCKFIPVHIDTARIKAMKDGEYVALSDQVVTASSTDMGNCFFVGGRNRVSGIKVIGASATRNSIVAVVGTLCTVDGEKTIKATSVTASGTEPIAAVAMTNKALGGADLLYDSATGAGQRGVEDGQGANNIGLLVRTTGKVTAVGGDFFYIDDGTHARDGSVFVGVRVVSRGIKKPLEGTTVTVTGISRIHKVGDRYFRCIWPRGLIDIMPAN